jgi:hypothetical protein
VQAVLYPARVPATRQLQILEAILGRVSTVRM